MAVSNSLSSTQFRVLMSSCFSDHHYVQLGKQVAWACVGIAWTFIVTYAIMFFINLIPGCHFRATDEAEIVGMDVSLLAWRFDRNADNFAGGRIG